MKAIDRRVKRTKKLLRQGLISLLMEKDINSITINELVTLVDINRGTFYLHYKDLYDLLHQIEDDLMCELTGILNEYNIDGMKDENKLFFVDILKFIKENADLVLLLLSQNGDLAFLNKLKKAVEENCFQNLKQLYQHANPYSYAVFTAYSVSGSIGVIQLWLENGHSESIESLAYILANIVEKGLGYLEAPNP